jgi:hypothetical protein
VYLSSSTALTKKNDGYVIEAHMKNAPPPSGAT